MSVNPALFELTGFSFDAAFFDLGSSVSGATGSGFLTGATVALSGIPNAPSFNQTLFSLELTALGAGTGSIALDGIPAEPLVLEGMFYTTSDVGVEATGEVDAVPEPGALSLLGAGLVGLWFKRRSRRA